MKYATDQMLAGLAKELREHGVECRTITNLVRGDENSSVKIPDPEIVRFLRGARGEWTLITMDNELVEYCELDNLPYIRIQDLVIDSVTDAD